MVRKTWNPGVPDEGASLDPAHEFEELIQRAHETLFACGWDGKRYAAFKPGGVGVLKFRSRSLALIRRVFGEEHAFSRIIDHLVKDERAVERGYHIREFLDVLERAYQAYQRRQLFDSAGELLAMVGSDVIELAETFINAGCHLPAARCAGDVLEQVLRRLAAARDISQSERMRADELAAALRQRDAIDLNTHRRIAACLQIAEDAAGRRGPTIPEGEILEMVRWVREFARKHRLLRQSADHPRG